MKCYIAGPMRGYESFNFPAFMSLGEYMALQGWEVANPAKHDLEQYPDITEWEGFAKGDIEQCPAFDFQATMRWDLAQVASADAIVLLPGWGLSSGVGHELAVANVCGVQVLYAHPRKYGRWLISTDEHGRYELPDVDHPRGSREILTAGETWHGIDVEPHVIDTAETDPTSEAYVPKHNGERRVVSETGGAKGEKDVQVGRLPRSILEVAEHFYHGSQKYPDVETGVPNWSLGYPWSSSYNALQRHVMAWWYGEDLDPELGNTHLAAVAFHALVLMDFQSRKLGTDDRQKC